MTAACNIYGCNQERDVESLYCENHTYQMSKLLTSSEHTEAIYDHIKINIEQSAKGARVTVTYDRSDHDIEVAVMDAILIYETTIKNLKDQGLKVDES